MASKSTQKCSDMYRYPSDEASHRKDIGPKTCVFRSDKPFFNTLFESTRDRYRSDIATFLVLIGHKPLVLLFGHDRLKHCLGCPSIPRSDLACQPCKSGRRPWGTNVAPAWCTPARTGGTGWCTSKGYLFGGGASDT